MGIQGLLPFLAKSTREAHISEFENMFVAIDAYCWLHKGIYSCAFELAMKKPTTKYITYCMRYIEMLLHFKVKPILVFDGRLLSSKKETEKKRREERKKKFERGKELIRAGKSIEGRKLLGESVDVTHELAVNLIRECREKNIDCVVAPFEADAQLAFLSLRNIVQCVITEDSDLLAYGCERVLFKMDTSGRGKLVEKNEIHLSLNLTLEEFNEDIFRYMCILSGCDYLPSLPSIGPANALKFVKMLKDKDIYEVLPRLPVYLNKMNVKVTPEYLDGFKVADNTFKHQLVYDPFERRQVPLLPVNNDEDIVGLKLPEDIAFQLAVGNIDPISMTKVDNFDPDLSGKGFCILWKAEFLPNATPRQASYFFSPKVNEARKRLLEGLESDFVQSSTNDSKKQRLPVGFNIKNTSLNKTVPRVPETGFIFEPIISDKKKSISATVDESKLLKSRYFSCQKDKVRDQKQATTANDKRKDETYEEYLQRLYEEYFPITNGDRGETNPFCCNKHAESSDSPSDTKSCSLCSKCRKCCSCRLNETVPGTQHLDKYIRELEEHKKFKSESPAHHFLLDEIHRNEEKESEANTNKPQKLKGELEEAKEKEPENLSPGQSLSIDFSKILSKIDSQDTTGELEESEESEVKTSEKENVEIVVCDKEEDPASRSPSPVFKVQKGKLLNRNFRMGNVPDTASTPNSVYFASSSSESIDRHPLVSRQYASSNQKKLSGETCNGFSSKLGKNSLKGTPGSRTLFQFGFKKERRSESQEGS